MLVANVVLPLPPLGLATRIVRIGCPEKRPGEGRDRGAYANICGSRSATLAAVLMDDATLADPAVAAALTLPPAPARDPRKAVFEANKLRKRLRRQVGEAIGD